jgi:hypothetical protein
MAHSRSNSVGPLPRVSCTSLTLNLISDMLSGLLAAEDCPSPLPAPSTERTTRKRPRADSLSTSDQTISDVSPPQHEHPVTASRLTLEPFWEVQYPDALGFPDQQDGSPNVLFQGFLDSFTTMPADVLDSGLPVATEIWGTDAKFE